MFLHSDTEHLLKFVQCSKEMGRSFVTTGRMVMMGSIGYKWDERKEKKESKLADPNEFMHAFTKCS